MMKIYFPIAKVDAERREVWGYASTEARDDQGEIVKRDALISALGDYMKFANIREMHQLSAVGVATEAAVDDKGLYVGAKIVDDQAWQKVVEGVYKGYSIGGRVTERDPADHKTITGLVLNEISLVDRPANPDAIFDYWKAGGTPHMPEARFNPPLQIWACGVPDHRHLAKSDAIKCQGNNSSSGSDLAASARSALAHPAGAPENTQTNAENEPPHGEVAYADPGYQTDRKKRYPIDTEKHIRTAWNLINRPSNALHYSSTQLDNIKSRIIAAWKKQIDEGGPPSAEETQKSRRSPTQSALTKALWDVGHVARIILDLNWLQESLAIEAAMEDDNSAQPSRLQAIIAELCGFLNAMVAEQTDEILNDTDIGGGSVGPRAAEIFIMAAGAPGAALVADLCRDRGPKMQKLAAVILAKAKHSDLDQALLDLAYQAVDKCVGMNSLLFAERSHMAAAGQALKAAGATVSEESAGHVARQPAVRSAASRIQATEVDPSQNSTLERPSHGPAPEVLEMVAAALGKRGLGQQALMDIAHDCIGKLTEGMCCVVAKAGARHSQEMLGHLTNAHDHLVAAGATCDANAVNRDERCEGTVFEAGKVASGTLAKRLAEQRAENAALIATLTDILPRLDQLSKTVEEIARTPLPPLAVAKNVAAISKQQDAGSSPFTADELAAAFSRMTKEEQTLTLIKASYARPIHPPGLAPVKDTRSE
jgi:Family of unknown function (DUF6582)/Caudovirus prohead serine protease